MNQFKSWSLQLFNDGAQAQGTGESTQGTVDAARTQDAAAQAQEEKKTVSPDEEFERCFGRRADKRRKLYNGMIKCQYYMYFK